MLSKLIILVLVYIVCLCNLLFVLSPFLAFLLPFIDYQNGVFSVSSPLVFGLLKVFTTAIFSISFLMMMYLFLDFILGFSVFISLKNCKRFEKYKEYDFLTPVLTQVKEKFDENSIRLYIKNSNEINAFAVGSLGSKNIIISRGMIDHFLLICPEPKMFLSAIRSVISHEMSHLINKDFIPAYIIMVNQKFTNLVSSILYFLFYNIAKIINAFPSGGRASSFLMIYGYKFFNTVIIAFNSVIVYNLFEFIRKFVSRSIEYRCDYQASKAFGGKNMAFALSITGDNGYFTIFSTHPKTKSRIKKIEDIKMSDDTIRPALADSIANSIAFILFALTTLLFAKLAHIDLFIREILINHENIYRKLSYLWHLINKIY